MIIPPGPPEPPRLGPGDRTWSPRRLLAAAPALWIATGIALGIDVGLEAETLVCIRRDDFSTIDRTIDVAETLPAGQGYRIGWYLIEERTCQYLRAQLQVAFRTRSVWLLPGRNPTLHVTSLDLLGAFAIAAHNAGYAWLGFSDLGRKRRREIEKEQEPPF